MTKRYYEPPILLKRPAMLATLNLSPTHLRNLCRKVGFDGYRI